MKICIVTGVTGTLGESLAFELLKEDYYVIGVSRKKCDYVHQNIICDLENFNLEKFETELTSAISKLQEMAGDGDSKISSIDFVQAAGYHEKEQMNEILSNEKILNKTFKINTFSFFQIVNVLVKICEKWKVKSSVVAVSTNLTIKRNRFTASYIASKAALEGMVTSFAQTYGYLNMRFNSVCPGMFASNMNNHLVPEQFETNTPLKRLGKVKDIVDAIMFLISEKASCITANKIVVDGGGSNGY